MPLPEASHLEHQSETLVFESDWLASRPFFYNERTGRSGANINEVIDLVNVEIDPEGFNDYLDFGFSVFGRTPVRDVRMLRHSSRLWSGPSGLRVEHLPDPTLEGLEGQSSVEDVLGLASARINDAAAVRGRGSRRADEWRLRFALHQRTAQRQASRARVHVRHERQASGVSSRWSRPRSWRGASASAGNWCRWAASTNASTLGMRYTECRRTRTACTTWSSTTSSAHGRPLGAWSSPAPVETGSTALRGPRGRRAGLTVQTTSTHCSVGARRCPLTRR